MSGPTVTSRVLAVLGAFTTEYPALSLTDISKRAGLPLSTAHRLLAELTSWGALERDEDGKYRIGLRLWEIGALAPRGLGLREVAMPFLEDVYEATRQNVQLAVLDGTDAVYVERISGRRAVHVITRPGSRLPLHATGVGLVLLAYSPLPLRQQVLAGPLTQFTEHTITEPSELRRTIDRIRRQGYAVSDRQIELVSLSVAAPVFGPKRKVVAGLSVVVPAEVDWHIYLPAVIAAARGLSRALGAQPGARAEPH